jgi:hypothetical protein
VIDLKADDRVIAVWFARQAHGWDWMACAVRRAGSSEYELLYRHRHDQAGESEPFAAGKDDKRWIALPVSAADEQALLPAVDKLLAGMRLGRTERVIVQGNPEAMMTALKDKPWAHASEAPAQAR